MSATITRPASAAGDSRPVTVALVALVLAVGLMVALTISRQVSFQAASPTTPAAVHDHGWSSASGAQQLVIRGENGGGILYTGIPYPAPAVAPKVLNPGEIMVNKQTPGLAGSGLTPRERFAK